MFVIEAPVLTVIFPITEIDELIATVTVAPLFIVISLHERPVAFTMGLNGIPDGMITGLIEPGIILGVQFWMLFQADEIPPFHVTEGILS